MATRAAEKTARLRGEPSAGEEEDGEDRAGIQHTLHDADDERFGVAAGDEEGIAGRAEGVDDLVEAGVGEPEGRRRRKCGAEIEILALVGKLVDGGIVAGLME